MVGALKRSEEETREEEEGVRRKGGGAEKKERRVADKFQLRPNSIRASGDWPREDEAM